MQANCHLNLHCSWQSSNYLNSIYTKQDFIQIVTVMLVIKCTYNDYYVSGTMLYGEIYIYQVIGEGTITFYFIDGMKIIFLAN